MSPRVGIGWLVGVATALAACGGSTPPAPAPPAQAPKPAATAPARRPAPPPAASVAQQTAAAAKAAAEALAPPKPKYQMKGRRDPFENLEVLAREQAASPGVSVVASAKLTGIVRGQIPLALIETTQGLGYILKSGDTLGEGRLIEIGSDQVVFAVPPTPGSTINRVVLKIAKD